MIFLRRKIVPEIEKKRLAKINLKISIKKRFFLMKYTKNVTFGLYYYIKEGLARFRTSQNEKKYPRFFLT